MGAHNLRLEVFEGLIDPITACFSDPIFTFGTPRVGVRVLGIIRRPEKPDALAVQ